MAYLYALTWIPSTEIQWNLTNPFPPPRLCAEIAARQNLFCISFA
jgi:hypothetical protein